MSQINTYFKVKQMNTNTSKQDLEYDSISIYPGDYSRDTRRKLLMAMKKLGIHFVYEQYA